jgi:hypothetical protein
MEKIRTGTSGSRQVLGSGLMFFNSGVSKERGPSVGCCIKLGPMSTSWATWTAGTSAHTKEDPHMDDAVAGEWGE